MASIIKNEHGKIEKIMEDGELVWNDKDYIQRPKIGDKTAQLLKEGKIQQYLARIHNLDLEASQ